MATFELLFSQARRHCFTTPPSAYSLLRSSPSSSSSSSPTVLGFRRLLCSSPPSTTTLPDSDSPDIKHSQSVRTPVPIQPVSYASKPKDQPKPEASAPQSPQPRPNPLPQEEDPPVAAANAEARAWTRDDLRYVKDAPPSLSPVSYPTKTAPLPEDRVAAPADGDRGAMKEEDRHLQRERERIEAARRGFKVELEKVPFPMLIKVEKKEKQKIIYDLAEAIRQVKANSKRGFDETLEAHVRLGLNMRRTDLTVRGAVSLPHGTGKAIKVAVFAEGAAADEARAAGADIVGGVELVEEIKSSKVVPNVDRCISTEPFMDHLKKISMILRNLMPNPRKGSVTNDVAGAVKEAKRGFIEFKMDKTAIVHVGLGKVSFPEESLRENIGAFVNALLLAKPAGLKKTSKYAGYVNSFNICSTMGPGFPVSIQSISMAADHYNKLHPRR